MFRLTNLKGFVAFHEKFLSGVPVATSQRPEYGSPQIHRSESRCINHQKAHLPSR